MDTSRASFSDRERDVVAAVCLAAANADGLHDDERRRLREVFEALGGVDAARLFQDVLLGGFDTTAAAAALSTPGVRAYAYEMAVGACDADGRTTPAERAFLDRLARDLGLEAQDAEALREQAEALATAPLEGAGDPTDADALQAPDLERTILNRAILAGGLELLPQSLATMAIVPVQMKLAHEIGRAHGYALDQGSVRELLAIAGVGLTSQVLEGYARKLFGGSVRKLAGKTAGALGKTATSAPMTFATTYAVGKAADAYYGGGRTLEQAQLRAVFARELERGKALFDRHQGQVRDRAASTNLSDLTRQLRG